MDKSPLLYGIETARNYTKIREQIEHIVDRIHAICDLMSLLKHADDASINHLTAAWIGNRIKTDALMILNSLDDLKNIEDDP